MDRRTAARALAADWRRRTWRASLQQAGTRQTMALRLPIGRPNLSRSSGNGRVHPGSCRKPHADFRGLLAHYEGPPYSHSIINGFCKPLIRLCDISKLTGFTVRCTATSRGIPARGFHHRSTSIESSRRVHDGQLSRSIAVYRVLGHWRALRRTSPRPAGDHAARPGTNEAKCIL